MIFWGSTHNFWMLEVGCTVGYMPVQGKNSLELWLPCVQAHRDRRGPLPTYSLSGSSGVGDREVREIGRKWPEPWLHLGPTQGVCLHCIVNQACGTQAYGLDDSKPTLEGPNCVVNLGTGWPYVLIRINLDFILSFFLSLRIHPHFYPTQVKRNNPTLFSRCTLLL